MGKYRYGLQLRPAAPGAIPKDNMAILPRAENSDIDPYYDYTRHGSVTYDHKLSTEEASSYDLMYLPTESELQDLAAQLANGRLEQYAAEYLEQFQEDPDMFKSQVKMFFRKQFPAVAYPLGAGQNLFIMDVLAELQKVVDAKAVTPEPKPEPVTEDRNEVDGEAAKAIEYLKGSSAFTSRNLEEISAEITHVQEAASVLSAAGVYDENEGLVNAAADHLIGILAEIQQGGN
ncbi:hypothetical protein N0P70_005895 [Klebsiella michiganensis]|nr:hypothetical protein [Klebsiella michiganensis]